MCFNSYAGMIADASSHLRRATAGPSTRSADNGGGGSAAAAAAAVSNAYVRSVGGIDIGMGVSISESSSIRC